MADRRLLPGVCSTRRSCGRFRFEITADWSAANGVLGMRRRELMLLLGGMVTRPHALRAQQKAIPVIGFLGSTSPGPLVPMVAAFRQGLSETGYVDGQDL